jgi:MFS family permease
MYFITYVDRVNVSTAAIEFSKDFHLSNTQVGLVFSAFAYPYLIFQVIGGWVGDRFGPPYAHHLLARLGRCDRAQRAGERPCSPLP